MRFLFSAFVLLFIVVAPQNVQAAEIRGIVIDATNNEPLPGASVVIQGTTKGVSTAEDGTFSLTNLASGTYTISVKFVGYVDYSFTLSLSQKQVANRKILLVPSSTVLVDVQVSARAVGQVRAMNVQREAINVSNIISQEQIQSFPDLNAADALQRIAGITLQRDQGEGRYVQLRGTPPEFTNFNVNGNQLPSPETGMRTIGMDVINASQLQTIEVTKVLTPDMNGDAIGGTINLVTKRAQSYEPTYNLLMAGGMNNLRQTGNGEFQFTFSQRKNRLGLLINANYNFTRQGADNIEFKYEKGVFFGNTSGDNYHIQYGEVQLRYYDLLRKRTGLSATLDYEIDEHTTVYLTGMYNNFEDDETRYRKVYTLDDALSETTYLYGGIEHDTRNRIKIQNISSVNMGAEHRYKKVLFDYDLGWSLASEKQPDRMEVSFENPGQAILIKFDMSDPEYPKATYPDPNTSKGATDFARYSLNQLYIENHTALDENLTARFNITTPYTFAGSKGFVKFGGLWRGKEKSRDINAHSYAAYRQQSTLYPLPGPPLNLVTVNNGFEEKDLLNQGYELTHMADPGLMRSFYEYYPTLFVYGDAGVTESRELSFGEDYVATENVYAAYGMVQHEIKKLTILLGLRYEQTHINYQGFLINKTTSGYFESLDTLTSERVQSFLLPNVQLKYRLSEGLLLRAAFTSTYARPNFRDVIPYRVLEERTEVRYGNPDLNYPRANNIDLMVEKYWGGVNLVSIGAFYKNIDDFIFNYKVFGFEGDPTQANFSKVQLEIPMNGQEAHVSGVELQAQFMLQFLPGKWRYLGIYSNYSYTQSEGQINKRYPANENTNIIYLGSDYDLLFQSDAVEIIPLPGQAPHASNLALFYDTGKFFIKIAANYNHEFLFKLGADPDLDEYYASNWRLDFNTYYQVTKSFQIFADVRNITNQPLKFYLGKPEANRVKLQEFYSFWARLGFRLNF